jgi:hypothetical protein
MRRLSTRGALVVWVVIIVVISLRVALSERANSVYPIFSDAGRKWLDGANLFDPPPPWRDVYRYSPAVAAGFAPWGLLSDRAGGVLWRWFNAAVLCGALVAWYRWWRDEKPGLSAILLLVLPLAIGGLNNGQCNALLAGLMLLATVAFARGRLWLAAAAVTCTVLFKGYPLALGLLFCLVEPRRFAPRLALGLAAGFVLPFLLQRPEYVTAQYAAYFAHLRADDRTVWPVHATYRDLHLLLRVAGWPVSLPAYRVIEVLAGLACAAIVLVGRRRGWGTTESAEACLGLGAVWMTLFGPATESCTYVLLAPVLARAVLLAAEQPWTERVLPYGSFGLFTLGAGVVWFPRWVADPVQTCGVQPIAACLLAALVIKDCLRVRTQTGFALAGG